MIPHWLLEATYYGSLFAVLLPLAGAIGWLICCAHSLRQHAGRAAHPIRPIR